MSSLGSHHGSHRRGHLGDRLAALVDGQLRPRDRDRALAHVAACAPCRAELADQRAAKRLLAGASVPAPAPELVASLQALAAPGAPRPPRAHTAPVGPVVPDLPPPGRGPRGARSDSRRSGPAGAPRRVRRNRIVTAGALSAAGLVLAAAFVAGGESVPSGPAVPPAAELSVEHSRTTNGVTVGDPGTGLMTTFQNPASSPTRR